MNKFARLDAANTVIETFEHETLLPGDTHIAAIAAEFISCPPDVAPGYTLVSGTWHAPAPVIPPAPRRPAVTPPQFFLLFTMAEQLTLESLRPSTPGLDLFFRRLEDVRLTEVDLSLASVHEGVAYAMSLCHTGDVSARVAEILTGVWR
jgi:hypothetical protein